MLALTHRHVLTHSWSVPTGGEPCCRTAGFWLGPGLPAPGCVCGQPGQVHPKVSRWGLSAHSFYALPTFSYSLLCQAGCPALCPFLNAGYILYITNLYKQETCLCMLYHISDSEPFLEITRSVHSVTCSRTLGSVVSVVEEIWLNRFIYFLIGFNYSFLFYQSPLKLHPGKLLAIQVYLMWSEKLNLAK